MDVKLHVSLVLLWRGRAGWPTQPGKVMVEDSINRSWSLTFVLGCWYLWAESNVERGWWLEKIEGKAKEENLRAVLGGCSEG